MTYVHVAWGLSGCGCLGVSSLGHDFAESWPARRRASSSGPQGETLLFRLKSFWNARAFTQSRAQVLQGQLGQNDEVHQVLKAFVVLGGR